MSVHVVTAHGGAVAYPRIVATDPAQHGMLVELALYQPPRSGVAARTHAQAYFYVSDEPIGLTKGRSRARTWLQVGHFAGFGGALFVDDTVEEGADWAWVALRPKPVADAPQVYLDQPGKTEFPPEAIMPLDELRAVVLDFVNTGARPASVDWQAVNALTWSGPRAG